MGIFQEPRLYYIINTTLNVITHAIIYKPGSGLERDVEPDLGHFKQIKNISN